MESASSLLAKHATARGVACGAAAALFWALGFVAARQGVSMGLSPLVIALHRFAWPGLVILPFAAADGFADLRGIGWRRGAALALCGAHRADRVMVAGRWRVIDGAPESVDLEALIAKHKEAARAFA